MLRSLCKLNRLGRMTFATNIIKMPSFSPTMETGKIQRWLVTEGQIVQMSDTLAEIETDKSAVPLESTDEFVIAKIIHQAGPNPIKVGEIIAYTVDDESELKNFSIEQSNNGNAKEQPKAESKKETKPRSSGKSYPKHTAMKMPALSPTMKAGKINSWNVKEGQHVIPGDILATVETDKATVDFEMQEEGYVAKILVRANEGSVDVGTDVILIVDNAEDADKFADFQVGTAGQEAEPEQPAQQQQAQKSERKQEPSRQEVSQSQQEGRVFISPKAKVLAQQRGIDYIKEGIRGSGPEGRIITQDIENFKSESKAPAQAKQDVQPVKEQPRAPVQERKEQQPAERRPLPADIYEEIPLSNMRKVIAERLTESKQNIPHYYLTSKIEMDALLNFKKKLQTDTGLKLSVNDFIIKAVSFASLEVPEANSQWGGDKILRFHDVDVAFAVDTGDGLITPIVKKANLKTISTIAKETKDLIIKAKDKKLRPDDFMGGTFTISNLGTMGIDNFSAVINPPQSCILAVGRTVKEPVFDEKAEKGFRFADTMTVTLSCDHRVVDGAVGAKWLQVFKKYIENPVLITL